MTAPASFVRCAPRRPPRRGIKHPSAPVSAPRFNQPTAEVQPTRPRRGIKHPSAPVSAPRFNQPDRASLRAEVSSTRPRRGSTNPTAPVSAPRFNQPPAEVQPTRPERPREPAVRRTKQGDARPRRQRMHARHVRGGAASPFGRCRSRPRQSTAPRLAPALPRVSRPVPPLRRSRPLRAGVAASFLKSPLFATKKKNSPPSPPVSSSSPSATETGARRPSADPSKRGAYRGIGGAFPPPFAARVRRPGPRRPAGRRPPSSPSSFRAPPAPRPARMPRPRRRRAPRAPSTATSARAVLDAERPSPRPSRPEPSTNPLPTGLTARKPPRGSDYNLITNLSF